MQNIKQKYPDSDKKKLHLSRWEHNTTRKADITGFPLALVANYTGLTYSWFATK